MSKIATHSGLRVEDVCRSRVRSGASSLIPDVVEDPIADLGDPPMATRLVPKRFVSEVQKGVRWAVAARSEVLEILEGKVEEVELIDSCGIESAGIDVSSRTVQHFDGTRPDHRSDLACQSDRIAVRLGRRTIRKSENFFRDDLRVGLGNLELKDERGRCAGYVL